MVKIRAAAATSLALLLATLSATLADDSWGDTAQYTNSDSVTQEQQSTETPATWEASKQSDDDNNDKKSDDDQKSDDNQKSEGDPNVWTPVPSNGDSNEDTTDASSNSWTQLPAENSWTQAPASSSNGKADGEKSDDDKSDTSPSSKQDEISSAQPPTPESDSKNDGDDTDNSSESTGTSESSGDSWKQEPSGGSQTTGGGSTPSSGGGKVPDGTWPTSTGAVQFTAPHIIKAGEVFDGKMQTFDRSDITCSEGEGQKDTAVFLVEAGGTLKNAIIGKNQKEGVHCDDHDCTIENVWWDDVCEDALSIKGGTASSVTTVTNCGARSASDKVVQHNGQGTVNIDGFYAESFGKLYRSCGTCGDIPRIVTVKNVYAVDPKVSVITVNKNYGDKATLSNIWVKTSGGDDVKVCQWSQGGDKPSNVGDGPSPPLCQYSESDVHINQDISQAGGSSPSTGSAPAASSDGSSTQQAPAPSTESSGKSDGGDDTKEAPAASSGGSQTTWSQPPATSTESSGDDNGGDDNTEAPAPSSSGSQATGGETPSTGSQTTGGGGGGSTPSSGSGKVPDGTWPTSTGTVQYATAQVIKAGEVFDGKMQTFERSDVTCEGQTESGSDTAVFKLEPGATLKNAIIGKNQMEGVHCDKHDCTIENVWWDDVCEDALSIKGGTASSVSTVTGGGARSADDKVIQHNGYGTVKIDGFYGEDISKLYRSCGTCGDRPKKVEVSNVYIVNPDNAVVTVNKNWGDEATLSNIWIKSAGDKVKICQWSQGNADGEPSMLGDGPSPPLCQYSESDVHINGDVSQAGGSTPSTGSTGGGSSTEQAPGTVSPASPSESDEGGSSTSQDQPPSTSSGNTDNDTDAPSTSGGEAPSQSSEDTKSGESKSKSSDENKSDESENKSDEGKSKSGDENNGDDGESKSSNENNGDNNKSGESKSDDDNSESTKQQENSPDSDSVTQSEVAGEAGNWNQLSPTAVDAEAATKKDTLTSSTPMKKCNVRRRKN